MYTIQDIVIVGSTIASMFLYGFAMARWVLSREEEHKRDHATVLASIEKLRCDFNEVECKVRVLLVRMDSLHELFVRLEDHIVENKVTAGCV